MIRIVLEAKNGKQEVLCSTDNPIDAISYAAFELSDSRYLAAILHDVDAKRIKARNKQLA